MRSYSRRELYAAGEFLGESSTERKLGGGYVCGGGGGGQPSQSTSYQTNLPEYAQPYVETMLGATQNQLFNTQPGAEGGTEITGFKPYTPYSTDPSKYIAGFSPMQQYAQQQAAGLQVPGGYEGAQNMAFTAGQQALGAQGTANQLMNTALGYGQAGAGYGQVGEMYGAQGAQAANLAALQAQRNAAMYGAQGAGYGSQAARLAPAAQMYGAQGAGYGSQAANLAGAAQGYGQTAADIGSMGLRAESLGRDVSQQARDYAAQQAAAGQQYARQATSPGDVAAYMSPYQQQVTDVAKAAAVREAQMADTAQKLGAARQGTYGGARETLMRAEREKNLMTNLSNIQAQGQQAAYDKAIQAMQYGSNLGLQGLSGAQAGLGTALQGAQTGLSGIGTAMQGQQAGLSGLNQAGSLYGLGMQGSQAGLAGLGQAGNLYGQGIQGAQAGLQGVGQQIAGGNLGLQGAQTGIQGSQAGMQGAGVGLSGIGQALGAGQYGLQGLSQANQSASTLGNLAGQQFGAQQNIINLQNQIGQQQQQQQQAIINQAIQDYATAQQYPLMQLGFMSNMLRGLPMQATTTQSYMPVANPMTQAIGTAGAISQLSGLMGKAKGGEIKSYAKGGIASYDVGGSIKSDLYKLDPQELQEIIKNTTSDTVRKDAQRIAKMKQMGLASGGIIAFADGNQGKAIYSGNKTAEDYELQDSDELKARREADIAAALERQNQLVQVPDTPIAEAPMAPAPVAPSPVKPPVPVKAPAAAPRGIEQVSNKIPGLSPTMQALYERSLPEERSIQDIIRETRKAREETIGVDTRAQEERARLMGERANLKEEAERTKSLRLAQFFASWGSTPGNTLVAGMQAFQKAVPTMIEDEKEARKAQNEVNKVIRELDKAARLEEEGDFDAAFKIKQNAAKDAKDLNKAMLQYQGTKEAAQIRATKSDNANLRMMELRAQQQRDKAIAELNKIRASKGYMEAKRKSEFSGDSEQIKKMREDGKATMDQLESEQRGIIQDADNYLQAVREERGVSYTTKEKPATAAPGTAANPIKLK